MAQIRCSCGKPFYAWHNPRCSKHPLPADGSPCECCGQIDRAAAVAPRETKD